MGRRLGYRPAHPRFNLLRGKITSQIIFLTMTLETDARAETHRRFSDPTLLLLLEFARPYTKIIAGMPYI